MQISMRHTLVAVPGPSTSSPHSTSTFSTELICIALPAAPLLPRARAATKLGGRSGRGCRKKVVVD